MAAERTMVGAVSVREAEADDVRPLADVLAAAFREDPVMSWLLPNRATRVARSRRYFTLELRHVALAQGCAWTCEGLSGAALCLPPGAWRLPPSVAFVHGRAYARAFGLRLPHATALQAKLERHHLREPHWYFPIIGVAPEQQGRGIGRRLMRPILERCDRDGLPAYLEASSERNAALYEHLGFETIRELRLWSSPSLRLMVRKPGAG